MPDKTFDEYDHEEDYKKAVQSLKDLPRYYIGEEVSTEYGNGILVSISMPSNGLYLSPKQTKCVVWYSTQKSTRFVQVELSINDIHKITKHGDIV